MLLTKRYFSLSLLLLCCFIAAVLTTRPGAVESCPPVPVVGPAWPRNSTVYINLSNLNAEQRRQVTAAIASWNQANQTNGSYVRFSFDPPPLSSSFSLTFQIGTTTTINNQHPASQIHKPDNAVDSQGNLSRATITFDLSVKTLDQSGQLVQELDETVSSTGFLKAALHELGHSMGFEEADNTGTPTGGACPDNAQIPGATVMNSICGANDWGNNMPTSVTPCDNQRISSVSQYQCSLSSSACYPDAFEPASCACLPGWGGSGGGDLDGCPDHPGSVECSSWFICEGCCPCTPIIVDVEGDGFNLTSAEEGVPFDLNANGVKQGRLAWSNTGSDDAWLVLDRNGNGVIDNGTEMFGNFTPQPSPPQGVSKNGFRALAVFDDIAFGGNADGLLSARDGVFRSLRLWQDLNHDGFSQATELYTLAERGLSSIDLNYKSSERMDQYGNHFRFRAKVEDIRGQQLGRWAMDVFLTSAP